MNKKCIWCGGKVNTGFAGVGYYCPHCNEELTEDEENDNGEKNIPEMQANAALIAAAPEMYRELGMIEDFLRFIVPRCCPYGSRMAKDMWMRIDKIIELRKKARGEE